MLDAVGLEERLRTVLPMLTRQIEALTLLQKSRKLGPDAAAKVAAACAASARSSGRLLTPLLFLQGSGADRAEGRRCSRPAVQPGWGR